MRSDTQGWGREAGDRKPETFILGRIVTFYSGPICLVQSFPREAGSKGDKIKINPVFDQEEGPRGSCQWRTPRGCLQGGPEHSEMMADSPRDRTTHCVVGKCVRKRRLPCLSCNSFSNWLGREVRSLASGFILLRRFADLGQCWKFQGSRAEAMFCNQGSSFSPLLPMQH